MVGLGGPARAFAAGEESFGAYARWFEQFLLANGVSEEDGARRRAILLSVIGSKTFALIEDLVAPEQVTDLPYGHLIEVLKNHYEPEASVIVSRFRFNSCYREENESVSAFVARLRKLAKTCQYADGVLDEMLRDRLVCGIRDASLQTRLLSQPQLTLESALSLACASEAAIAQAQEIGRGTPATTCSPATEHLIGRVAQRGASRATTGTAADVRGPASNGARRQLQPSRQNRPQLPPCRRCRSQRHSPSRCWARSRRCFQCGEMGHVRDACDLNGRTRTGQVGQLEASEILPMHQESTDEDSGEVYQLNYQRSAPRKSHPPLYVTISLNGREARAKVDIGAAVSVCSVDQFSKLFPDGGPEIKRCARQLCTYGGDRLTLRGETIVCVQYRSTAVNLPLIIVEGEGPLLFGRDWLYHFRLDWAALCRVSEAHKPPVTGNQSLDPVLAEFPDVFRDELGCFKGKKVSIDVDPEAVSRFFKARPVPLAYRTQVDAELDRQLELGLWETVKSSRWAAPMVVVPKADGSLRLCGDYRLTVNKVAREHQYPLPRVEILLSKLSGCSIFSKVDLKSAYNQLVLDDKAREYLTLNTPRGLVRPTRLSFGYASAPSLFQRTLDNLLCGLPGMAVFLDDVIIAALSSEVHLERLREVLKRLSESGLRVNREKCRFGVSSVTYLGYTVSGVGVHSIND